ncbi:MAG: hypothetical protein L0229_31330, partial [Blastocatellia bacterium]|nr:hypothetical protein [Blastocatellia bacterium]
MVRDHLQTRRRDPESRRLALAVILIFLISISILPPSPGLASAPLQDVQPLHTGAAIERKLGRGDSHSYLIKLDS